MYVQVCSLQISNEQKSALPPRKVHPPEPHKPMQESGYPATSCLTSTGRCRPCVLAPLLPPLLPQMPLLLWPLPLLLWLPWPLPLPSVPAGVRWSCICMETQDCAAWAARNDSCVTQQLQDCLEEPLCIAACRSCPDCFSSCVPLLLLAPSQPTPTCGRRSLQAAPPAVPAVPAAPRGRCVGGRTCAEPGAAGGHTACPSAGL